MLRTLRGLLTASVVLLPATLLANPSPRSRPIHDIAVVGLISFAFAVEILVTALILIKVCEIERRALLVASLLLLNVATFCIFILLIQPRLGSVPLTELMIWLAEAGALVFLTRMFSEIPLHFRGALAAAFVGNLLSFLVGLAL